MSAVGQAMTAVFLVARLAWWPLSTLLHALVALAAPFYHVAVFVALPLLHAASTAIHIASLPFTVQWLERIETLYVYLGTAALIGCITGGVVYTLFGFLSSALHMDAPAVPAAPARRRTATASRAAKAGPKQAPPDRGPAVPPEIVKKVPEFRLRRGLLSSAVIEEEDSDL